MIKTILVPTDGSDHAEKAVTLAADIAEKYGAKLVLLHVLPSGPLPESVRRMAEVEHLMSDAPPDIAEAIAAIPQGRFPASTKNVRDADTARKVFEFLGQRLLVAGERIARDKGAPELDTAITEGDPAKRILDYAEREDANLIVMGSRGLGDFKGLLVGSVSHKVSHIAPCTVVTVR
jgi:nucleotide-binding universal stress UspA family protein